MKRIYGRALFHRQRTDRSEACRRYRSSPKSKLPRTPIRMSRAVVKGSFNVLLMNVYLFYQILTREVDVSNVIYIVHVTLFATCTEV